MANLIRYRAQPPVRLLISGLLIILATTLSAFAGDEGIYIGPDPSVPGWERADPARWSPNRAATAGELVVPLLAGPLETLDAKPDVKAHIWANGDEFRAAVVVRGLADDSVSATETVLVMTPTGDAWVVKEIWQRWTCARGQNAGKWTNKPCP